MEPKPAPGNLRLVQELVNTLDLDHQADKLHDTEHLARWSRDRNLLLNGVEVTETDLTSTIAFRELLRELLYVRSAEPPYVRRVSDKFNALTSGLSVRIRFSEEGDPYPALPAEDVDSMLGSLLGIVSCARADGSWDRLRACANPDCKWIFYDASKNSSGSWCRMGACGNRAKSRAFRERARRSNSREG